MDYLRSAGELIDRSARLYGDNLAYCHDGATLSFRKLAHDSAELSHHLELLGVGEGEPVAVVLDKSLNYIRALAAILKVGAIYVPLDAKNPDERVRYILRDSGARYVITTSASIPRLSGLADSGVRLIAIDQLGPTTRTSNEQSSERPAVKGTDVAYLIYTSGSTSMPKGVAIRHESLLNYVRETVAMYGFDEHTRIVSVKPFSFDASFTDLFCPLYAGGTVYLLDETLIFPQVIEERIQRYGITHISCTLPVFKLLAQKGTLHPSTYATMKTMSVGGDVVMPEVFHKIKSKLPQVRLFNRYGPTETTVACCTYEVTMETDWTKPVPIGKPHNNVRFRVINSDGQNMGVGESGELYIGGVQVMEGYWRAPELTEKAITVFEDGLRYYRTSDLVTVDENGDYVFLRRLDNIVKKHGYRISLEEIEFAIVREGITDECVCVFTGGDDSCELDRPKIVAYLRAEGGIGKEQETRQKLHKFLPNFMVPDVLVYAEQIPRGPSGKPARQVLRRQFLEGIQASKNTR
jgi:amino acid adenylation domain-containing protein